MKHFIIATVTAGSLAAAALGLAGAAAAATEATPSAPHSPSEVVKHLEAKGYEVIVTSVSGNDPQHCSISAVRHGQTVTGKTREIRGVQTPVAPHTTMYVDLRC